MKTKHLLLLSILVITTLVFGFMMKTAKSDAKTFADMYQPVWNNAVASTLAVAEAMPEDLYDYKPTEISKTFGQQIIHIGYASNYMAYAFLQGKQAEYKEPDAATMTKEEIIIYTEQQLKAVAELIGQMNPNDWTVEVKSLGGNMMPKSQAMIFVQDHLTNHRAKANLYIRMNNIDPPKYSYY